MLITLKCPGQALVGRLTPSGSKYANFWSISWMCLHSKPYYVVVHCRGPDFWKLPSGSKYSSTRYFPKPFLLFRAVLWVPKTLDMENLGILYLGSLDPSKKVWNRREAQVPKSLEVVLTRPVAALLQEDSTYTSSQYLKLPDNLSPLLVSSEATFGRRPSTGVTFSLNLLYLFHRASSSSKGIHWCLM